MNSWNNFEMRSLQYKNIHSGKKGGKGKKGAKEEEDAGWKMPKSEYFDDVGREITTQKDVWRNRIVYAPWFIFNQFYKTKCTARNMLL